MSASAIIAIVLLCLAGISKAVMDQSSEGLLTGPWWNKEESFRYKWKLDANGYLTPASHKPWYYFGFAPPFVERFPFSSTLLVFITDAWHLFQFFTFNCIYLAVAWYVGHDAADKATVFVICKAAVNLPFVLFRRFILKNKV